MTDDDVPLDIVLHTLGGLVLAALQIAHAIRAHKAKVTVFVPLGFPLVRRLPECEALWAFFA
jgi:ATP-dependent protease ClpP protease subunit